MYVCVYIYIYIHTRTHKDVNLVDAQGVAQCPNIIVAATLVDYCRPIV